MLRDTYPFVQQVFESLTDTVFEIIITQSSFGKSYLPSDFWVNDPIYLPEKCLHFILEVAIM
jgi:hypothetical protein